LRATAAQTTSRLRCSRAVQAIVIERNGGPDVLEVRDEPDPNASEESVVVAVEAVGVNFRDIYEREGGYGLPPPAIIGAEGAGRVTSVGPRADGFAVGQRVAWLDIPRSYAQHIAAPADRLVALPEGISTELAAATMLQGLTAHYLACDSYPVQEGDWVVVHAAAGGVGHLLTQIVKLRGGKVLATASTEEKAQLARDSGADEVTHYEEFAERARELTQGDGVAAVYDGVGKATFLRGLKALRPFGHMILYGAASGQPDPFPLAQLAPAGSLYVQRPTLGTYTRTRELLAERAAEVLGWVADGRLRVRIGARYPLAEARQAQEDLAARKTTGKLLLMP
jgi:NADPH2:quinone reductase